MKYLVMLVAAPILLLGGCDSIDFSFSLVEGPPRFPASLEIETQNGFESTKRLPNLMTDVDVVGDIPGGGDIEYAIVEIPKRHVKGKPTVFQSYKYVADSRLARTKGPVLFQMIYEN